MTQKKRTWFSLGIFALACGGTMTDPSGQSEDADEDLGPGGDANSVSSGGSDEENKASSGGRVAASGGRSAPDDGSGGSTGGVQESSGGNEGTGGAGMGGATEVSHSGGSVGEEEDLSLGELGAACPSAGMLACAGGASSLTLLCGAGKTWESGTICEDGRVCDPYAGSTAGTCVFPEPRCEGKGGQSFCDEENQHVLTCDSFGLFTETSDCVVGCKEGACVVESPPCPTPAEGENVLDCRGICVEGAGCAEPEDRCAVSVRGVSQSDETWFTGKTIYARIPRSSDLCEDCKMKRFPMELPEWSFASDVTVKVPEGWGVIMGDSLSSFSFSPMPCQTKPKTGCVHITGYKQDLFFVPLEPPLGDAFVELRLAPAGTTSLTCSD